MAVQEKREARTTALEERFTATAVWHIYRVEHEQRHVLGCSDRHVTILLPHGMAARLTTRQRLKLRERIVRRDWVSTVADTTVLTAGVASTMESALTGEFTKVSILIVLLAAILFIIRMGK